MTRRSAPGIDALSREEQEILLALLADLRSPVAPPPSSAVLAIDFIESVKPIIAYHLMRCGWRPDLAKRKIKARKVYGPGLLDGAVTWVPITAPDDPLANLPNMTIAEIEALEPEDVKLEAKRRLGMHVDPPKPPDEWHTRTHVQITDAPDPDNEEPTL